MLTFIVPPMVHHQKPAITRGVEDGVVAEAAVSFSAATGAPLGPLYQSIRIEFPAYDISQ
jgi:hypothetical protein